MTGRPAYPLPSAAALNRYREAFNQSGMIGHFGLRLEFPDVETVEVVLDPILPTQRGGLGTDAVNGGVIGAMGAAAAADSGYYYPAPAPVYGGCYWVRQPAYDSWGNYLGRRRVQVCN